MAKKRTTEDWFLRGGTRPSEDDQLPEETEIPPDDDDWDEDEGRCPECGTYLDGDEDICPGCGDVFRCPRCKTPLDLVDEETCPACGAAIRQICRSCGGANPVDGTECTHCGASLTVASDLSPSDEAPSLTAEIYGYGADAADGGASPGGFGPLWRPW